MLLTFYILLGFYFTVVITHALTRANVPPEMIVGPCIVVDEEFYCGYDDYEDFEKNQLEQRAAFIQGAKWQRQNLPNDTKF